MCFLSQPRGYPQFGLHADARVVQFLLESHTGVQQSFPASARAHGASLLVLDQMVYLFQKPG